MRLVISDSKTGKSYQVELDKAKESLLIGRKIGDKLDGGPLGAPDYSFVITGGSDSSGFPMRKDVPGTRKIAAILTEGPGLRPKRKGERRKKMVRGNTVSADCVQVNVKVEKTGQTALDALFAKEKK